MRLPFRSFSRSALVVGLSVVVLVVAVAASFELRRVGSLYWYDVTADQNYEFTGARSTSVRVDQDGFDWPAGAGPASTAVLVLDVRSGFRGRWSEPAVEMRVGDSAPRTQYLERKVAGRRYLNLGRIPDGVERVGLRGRHLGWDEQTAELLLFESAPADSGTVLILASHPDDAEIAAFGLYSTSDAWVVTISAGNNVDARMAHLEDDPVARSRLKGELRVWDSVAVPLWGGVPPERALNLGYFNQSLAALYREPRRIVADPVIGSADIGLFRSTASTPVLGGRAPESSWASLVGDLESLLEFVQPATIVTPHPALDAAPDHKLTTVALIEALDRVGAAGIQLLLYTNHASRSEYFPFGPAESVVSLPPWPGPPLVLAGVSSVPLDEDQRLRKLYALEAQHDLRPSPRVVEASPLQRIAGVIGRGVRGLVRDPTDNYSYMRRAPRPNELFMSLPAEDARSLLEEIGEFLEDVHAGRVRGGGY
jgi:LmbE family N-acetylglucosaminyl deacetylase